MVWCACELGVRCIRGAVWCACELGVRCIRGVVWCEGEGVWL